MPNEPVQTRVSEIGEFIRFQSCERRFKLGLDNRHLARAVPFSERLFNTLDPVLQEVRWETALQDRGARDLTCIRDRDPDSRSTPWAEFRAALEALASETTA